jgi:regulator of sigma E protease
VIAILIFSLIIFLHELGHFVAARCCNITVEEFAIGMGPKILSRKSKKSGTVYSWRLFPIGGFTAMKGENEEVDDEHAFNNRPWWQRLIVLLAGALTNILSAFLVMAVIVLSQEHFGSTTIHSFPPDEKGNMTSSQTSGLEPGDTILKVGNRTIHVWTELAYAIVHDGIEPLDITVNRNGEVKVIKNVVFPTTVEDGIKCGMVDFKIYGMKKTFGTVIKETVFQSLSYVKWVYEGLYDMITGRYGMEAVSGPVGVVSAIDNTVKQEKGYSYLPTLFVLISINLGVVNLLPLPALDGGRIVFVLVEAVRRKRISAEKEGLVHLVGLAVLVALIVFISIFDIIDLFS